VKSNFLFATLLGLVCGNAYASLLEGQSLSFQAYFPDLSSPLSFPANGTYVVGSGVEITNLLGSTGTIDIEDGGFTFDSFGIDFADFSPGSFNGFVLTDVNNTIADFNSFSILSNTMTVGNPVLSFDANNLYINLAGLQHLDADQTDFIRFSVNGDSDEIGSVPLPAALPLMLSGLGILGLSTKRKSKS
jgi:hypothetical protein